MNILVTGGAGFIGTNFIKYMLSKYEDYRIINLDLLTYAGNPESLNEFSQNKNYHFVNGDIGDKIVVNDIFNMFDIQVVINFAAESHVDRSIDNPSLFLMTNVIGTEVLLDAAKRHWKLDSFNKSCRDFKHNVNFIQISTDEVYGTLDKDGLFNEETKITPNSPYSASKASADMVARAYYETYGLPIMITRCSNNYGPYQHSEKLIPLVINRALRNLPVPVYGDGKQIRDWLYVEDHCIAIDNVLHKGKIGEVYNVGGNNEKENIDIVKLILNLLNKEENLIEYVEDRLGHDRRYAIDNEKIVKEIGWTPLTTFEKGLKKTIEWYLDNMEWNNLSHTNHTSKR
ncbi:dTDP-glucose 4,6-dehydratase [Sporosarcina sp. FA9]|uniref:dTDP-glucose 4,6-dehydratase n=1 Tax=Sporosarcina sp. FA9 TaxID=3413030 RepID=UPI003F65EC16